jgi:hypothetical protein
MKNLHVELCRDNDFRKGEWTHHIRVPEYHGDTDAARMQRAQDIAKVIRITANCLEEESVHVRIVYELEA